VLDFRVYNRKHVILSVVEHPRAWDLSVADRATEPSWHRCSKCNNVKIPPEMENLVFGPYGTIEYYSFPTFVCVVCINH
jgi:hypothetical protein